MNRGAEVSGLKTQANQSYHNSVDQLIQHWFGVTHLELDWGQKLERNHFNFVHHIYCILYIDYMTPSLNFSLSLKSFNL